MKQLNPLAYKENVISPQSREVVGTECHPTDRFSYFLDFDIHPITIGTDESKTTKIIASGIQNGIKFKNIGAGVEWNGGSMKSTGGGQKINLIREYIKELPDHDVLFFCDGYDTFVVTELDEIIRRYLDFSHSIVFAAERICWPNEELATQIIKTNKGITPYTDTPYKYLNSGLFVGTVKELRSILQDVDDASDDQLYYQEAYLSGHYDMALDLECYIFQCRDSVVNVNEEQITSSSLFTPSIIKAKWIAAVPELRTATCLESINLAISSFFFVSNNLSNALDDCVDLFFFIFCLVLHPRYRNYTSTFLLDCTIRG